MEYFISAESHDKKTLYGFVRLRLCAPAADVFPELEGCALIRELHVYSNMRPVLQSQLQSVDSVQHKGIGRRLLGEAEAIARDHAYRKVAVIAGVGTIEYYKKHGYIWDHNYMIKKIDKL
jgi:histone acetyltransferase (RNA polymerase elongator complex component)